MKSSTCLCCVKGVTLLKACMSNFFYLVISNKVIHNNNMSVINIQLGVSVYTFECLVVY